MPTADSSPNPPRQALTREAIRFLADVASRPLSTTVSRYQRLNLSRRKGNAIRQQLAAAGIIEAIPIATRSGQVMLCELTDLGRTICVAEGIDPGPVPRAGLEHRFWVLRTAAYFEKQGFDVTHEHVIDGNGAVDLVAVNGTRRIAIEVETGKSDIEANLSKVQGAGFDRIILLATSPSAMAVCRRAVQAMSQGAVEILSWLDVS